MRIQIPAQCTLFISLQILEQFLMFWRVCVFHLYWCISDKKTKQVWAWDCCFYAWGCWNNVHPNRVGIFKFLFSLLFLKIVHKWHEILPPLQSVDLGATLNNKTYLSNVLQEYLSRAWKWISLYGCKSCLIASNSCLHWPYIQWLIQRIPKGRLSHKNVSKMQTRVESAL